jgi:hypothetical protein
MPDEISDLPPEWLAEETGGEPPKRSMLRELAEDPDSELIEMAPGVWWQPKRRPDRDKLS